MVARGDPTIVRDAPVDRIPLGESSWVDLVSGFARDHDTEFEARHRATAWEQVEVLRYDHYVPERRLGARLRTDQDPFLRQTTLHLERRYRAPMTGVAAVLYRDGDDFQGLHSDREMRWLDDTVVAIVVLGARRPFVLRPRTAWPVVGDKVPAGTGPDDVVLMPGAGDLLVMGGRCQRDWLHGVPAARRSEPRISLTWRWSSRRGRPDTNPGFYDGFQFADRPPQRGSRSRRV